MTKGQLEENLAELKGRRDGTLIQLGILNQAIGTCEQRLAENDYQDEPPVETPEVPSAVPTE